MPLQAGRQRFEPNCPQNEGACPGPCAIGSSKSRKPSVSLRVSESRPLKVTIVDIVSAFPRWHGRCCRVSSGTVDHPPSHAPTGATRRPWGGAASRPDQRPSRRRLPTRGPLADVERRSVFRRACARQSVAGHRQAALRASRRPLLDRGRRLPDRVDPDPRFHGLEQGLRSAPGGAGGATTGGGLAGLRPFAPFEPWASSGAGIVVSSRGKPL